MYLLVEYENRSYYGISDATLTLSVIDSNTQYRIECGGYTIGAKGLFHLFVLNKKIEQGTPQAFYVKVTPQEAKIFKMIVQAEFWRKRSFWKKVPERDRSEVLKELKEKLPVYILSSKLEK